MQFEQFVNKNVQKINPQALFDLSRDARITALENLFVAKNIATKAEIDFQLEVELTKTDKMVNSIASNNIFTK